MAQKTQFLGFKRVLTGATMQDNYLYFERANGNAVEGKLWFNGVCYGSCRDTEVDAINEVLAEFLSQTGESKTVKEYIDEAVATITSGMTTSVEKADGAFSGLTIVDNSETPGVKDYIVDLQNVAPADELAAEIEARENADQAINAELDAVEGSLGFTGTAYTNSGHYISGDTVAQDIDRLDDAIFNVQSDFNTEVDAIESAVGLNVDGSHIQSSGRYTSGAKTVEGEISALDSALQDVADRTITEGSSTERYVSLDVVTENGDTTISINDSALTAAIEAMDLSEVHEAGKAIIAVSEADGVVSATAGTIAAQYVDVADADNHFTASNVEDALAELYTGYTAGDAAIVGDATTSGDTLGKLEDRIEALDADAKEYHIVKTTTGLPETIKERYSLVDAQGNVSGDTVDIPKDSHIVSITYITDSGDSHYQNLKYEYIDVSGNTQDVYVDMSQLVLESEFASGVTSIDGVVRGVVDPQSETFLTVGADGFKLSGVQDAIDDAVEAEENARKQADSAITEDLETTAATLVQMIEDAQASATTEVVEGTDAGNNLSIAETAGADGHKIYTVNLTDVASASALTQEISDRGDADEALQAEIDAVEAGVGLTSGGTWAPGSGQYTSASTSVADAINKLDAAITESESDWEDALAAEVSARTAADQTLAGDIADEASARTAADNALDARLDVIEDAYITAMTVNGVDAMVADNAADVTIDAGDIEVGTALSGTSVTTSADDKVDEVLQSIIDALDNAKSDAYTGVTGADGSISVAGNDDGLGHNLSVNVKELDLADVQAGETEIKKEEGTGALYGVMYWIDEETA